MLSYNASGVGTLVPCRNHVMEGICDMCFFFLGGSFFL